MRKIILTPYTLIAYGTFLLAISSCGKKINMVSGKPSGESFVVTNNQPVSTANTTVNAIGTCDYVFNETAVKSTSINMYLIIAMIDIKFIN